MRWFFEQHRHGGGPGGDAAAGLISFPAVLLQRHGARVLDPAEAAAAPGSPVPLSTVYRARTLLVPGTLLQDDNAAPVNEILAGVGMRLASPGHGARPGPQPGQDASLGDGRVAEALRRLPRPAALTVAAATDDQPAAPVVIDAWVALQALRAAVTTSRYRNLAAVVGQISLEHLLVGSAITGSPASGSGGGLAANPSDSSGLTGPRMTDSYTYSGGDTRAPVALCLPAPPRRTAGACEREFGRRPVIAVVDTGVRAHPWLDVAADGSGGYDLGPGGFVAVDHAIQDAIYAVSKQAADAGDQPRQPVQGPWDRPVTADPLVGELDTDSGHGTFIAGLARQVVPDAQVLAVRVMHSDGVVYEGDLLCALAGLAARAGAAADASGAGMAAMVDVVSLSLGYFDETADDVSFSTGLRAAIDLLLSLGVAVVAAAGNYATSRRFYPAAFTQPPPPAGQVPLVSVGALNPNGSKALFSDGGHWISAWATGAAVVSTFPVDINGSRTPEIRVRAHPANELPPGSALLPDREALDPDDYRGGFATWSGTSFSAPLVAAQITRALLAGAEAGAPGLDVPGPQAAAERVLAALQSLGWPG